MKCVIVSGGCPPSEQLLNEQLNDSDFLIGVDGAADVLTDLRIIADVLIGDFDTAKKKNVLHQQNGGAEVIRLDTRKNETDTEAALNYAIERGAQYIVLLSALGSRQDHTQANIALLKKAHDSGIYAKIIDDNNELFVCSQSTSLHAPPGQTISILPLCSDIIVSASGLEYPLKELPLTYGTSRGVSNVIKNSPVGIHVSGGYALIILSNGSL